MSISDEFAREYCEGRIKKEYESLLDYAGEIYCITYERLTAYTKETVAGMVRHLGMEDADHIIEAMVREGDFKNLVAKDSGGERNRGEESLTSHFRKGIVGDWENYLSASQCEMIEQILGDLQKKVFTQYRVIH